jgi:hypothetical protein
VTLVDADDVRHEGFLCRFDELDRQIGYVHIAPFKRQYHLHDSLNNHGVKILIVASKDNLLFLQNGRKYNPQSKR